MYLTGSDHLWLAVVTDFHRANRWCQGERLGYAASGRPYGGTVRCPTQEREQVRCPGNGERLFLTKSRYPEKRLEVLVQIVDLQHSVLP